MLLLPYTNTFIFHLTAPNDWVWIVMISRNFRARSLKFLDHLSWKKRPSVINQARGIALNKILSLWNMIYFTEQSVRILVCAVSLSDLGT
jgi:hypothetical protein